MAADATLVNMAYRAAMANVPGDWSKSFNKQYEGLIAAHQARADFGAAVVKGVADVGIGIKQTQAESIKGMGVSMDISHIYNNLSNTTAQEGIKAHQQHYENGGGSNPGEMDAAQESMQVIGEQLEPYSTDIYMSKDDKYNQAGLYRAAEMQKGEIIQDKAKKREVVDAYANNMVNLELTYGGDGEKSLLLKQILDPKADWGKLGIRAAWEGGKKYYYYSGGRLKAEYDASRPPRREGDDYVSTDVSRSPLINPPGYEPTDTEIRVSAEEL